MRFLLAVLMAAQALGSSTKQCLSDGLGCSKCETFAACTAYTDAAVGGGGGDGGLHRGVVILREDAPGIVAFGLRVDLDDPFADLETRTKYYFRHDGITDEATLRFHYTVNERVLEVNDDDTLIGAMSLAAQMGQTLELKAFLVTDAPSMSPSMVPTMMPSGSPTNSPTPRPTEEYYSVHRHIKTIGNQNASWGVIGGTDSDPLVFVAEGDTKLNMEFALKGQNHGGIRLVDITTGTVFGGNPTYGFDWLTVKSNVNEKRNIQRILPLKSGQEYKFRIEGRSNSGTMTFHNGDDTKEYAGLWVSLQPMRSNYQYVHNAPQLMTTSTTWSKAIALPPMELERNARLLVSLDISAYGQAHGGTRFQIYKHDTNELIETYGEQPTYGYDTMVSSTNEWEKRMDEFLIELTNEPGKYRVETWYRSTGSAGLRYAGGNAEQLYSGSWMVVEEIPSSVPAVFKRDYRAQDMYTATWTDMTGWTDEFETSTGKFCFYAGMQIYGATHGGCRLVSENGKMWGKNPSYGFDWMIAEANQWFSRSISRVLETTPNEKTRYRMECRSQSDGSRFYLRGGTESQEYGGKWIVITEC